MDENDKISNLSIWHKLYTINVDSFTTNILPIQSQVNIYTDGSKTKTYVGAGYSIMRGNQVILEGKQRLPDEATVFQAELMAIKMAMFDLAGYLENNDRYIKLFSDSRSAIQALNSNTVSSQLVRDTVNAINLVGGKVNRLEISWIKAHVGHLGNERADQLAREAAELTPTVHGIMPPYSFF